MSAGEQQLGVNVHGARDTGEAGVAYADLCTKEGNSAVKTACIVRIVTATDEKGDRVQNFRRKMKKSLTKETIIIKLIIFVLTTSY